MRLSKWRDCNDNEEIANCAGEMAWGAICSWAQARDVKPPTTADACRELAADICVEDGGRIVSDNDPAGDVAREVLSRNGYRVVSGHIGFDETIAKA